MAAPRRRTTNGGRTFMVVSQEVLEYTSQARYWDERANTPLATDAERQGAARMRQEATAAVVRLTAELERVARASTVKPPHRFQTRVTR